MTGFRVVDGPAVEAPRLSLMMLFVLLACVGAALAVTRALGSSFASSQFLEGLWAVQGVLNGVGLAGILLALDQWRHRSAYPRHPGEWLWLIQGAGRALGMVASAFFALALGDSQGGPPDREWLVVAQIVVLANLLVVSGLYFFPALLCRERRWKAVFWLLIGSHLAFVAWQCLELLDVARFAQGMYVYFAMRLLTVIPATASLVAVVADAGWKASRPWTHWTGVVLYWIGVAILAVSVVYQMLRMWS